MRGLCARRPQNYSYVVEAWSARNDLGDVGTPARRLAASAPLLFRFDDLGFGSGLRFANFSATEHAPGAPRSSTRILGKTTGE